MLYYFQHQTGEVGGPERKENGMGLSTWLLLSGVAITWVPAGVSVRTAWNKHMKNEYPFVLVALGWAGLLAVLAMAAWTLLGVLLSTVNETFVRGRKALAFVRDAAKALFGVGRTPKLSD